MSSDSPGQAIGHPQENTQELEQLWADVLGQLQLTTARQTFDAWLRDTYLVSLENGAAVIGVKNAYAKDWLENRLADIIHRTLADLLNQVEIDLQFTVIEQPERDAFGVPYNQDVSPEIDEADLVQPLTPGQKMAQADPYKAHFDKGGAGYLMVSNYQNIYWLAYLGGEAYALWQRLANEKIATIKQIKDRWTDSHRYSYTELAGWLNLSHSCYISGCIRECHNSRLHVAETEQQIPDCCRNHYPESRVKTDADGRDRCMFWKEGHLQILHREGLVAIKESKARNRKATRSHVLEIQTWRALPPLTPHQVSQLDPRLQKSHDLWIETWGPKLYGITLKEWRDIQETIIVPAMTGYSDFRRVDGPYRPNEHFLRLARWNFHES